jgi:hypothetical protein
LDRDLGCLAPGFSRSVRWVGWFPTPLEAWEKAEVINKHKIVYPPRLWNGTPWKGLLRKLIKRGTL